MDYQIAVIRQNPLALGVSFETVWKFTGVFLETLAYLIRDRLHLPLVRSGADHEGISKRSNTRKVEDFDIDSLLRFGCTNSEKPSGGGNFRFGGGGTVCRQNTLLTLWYNSGLMTAECWRHGFGNNLVNRKIT